MARKMALCCSLTGAKQESAQKLEVLSKYKEMHGLRRKKVVNIGVMGSICMNRRQ